MRVLLAICLLLVASQAEAQQSVSVDHAQTREAERRLAELGYWTGPVDGRFDAATRSALIAFQKWERRAITGKLTVEELERCAWR